MLNQRYEEAKEINKKLEPLHSAMFLESNPIPVKWLLSYLGKINSKIRLPLVSLDEKISSKTNYSLRGNLMKRLIGLPILALICSCSFKTSHR